MSGTVTDAETGDALPGATVVIVRSSQGASTDLDGSYRITGIEPGTYGPPSSVTASKWWKTCLSWPTR